MDTQHSGSILTGRAQEAARLPLREAGNWASKPTSSRGATTSPLGSPTPPPPRHRPHRPLCKVSRRNLRKIKAAANLSGAAWQADVLRHSFASYALKVGTTLSELLLDMGHRNSAMLRARYLNIAGLTRTMADAWWSLTPATILHTPANSPHGFPPTTTLWERPRGRRGSVLTG